MPAASDDAIAGPPARRLWLCAMLCWGGLALVAILLRAGRLDDFDRAGLLLWRDIHPGNALGPRWLLPAMHGLTAFGGVAVRSALALCAAGFLMLKGLRRPAAIYCAAVLCGWAANSALKQLAARARPEVVTHLADASGYSFPSGHSFNAAVVYLAMAMAFAPLVATRSARAAMIGAAIAFTLLIALSRVWLGVHYPSDAIAGWLGGAGWACAAAALSRQTTTPRGC